MQRPFPQIYTHQNDIIMKVIIPRDRKQTTEDLGMRGKS